MTRIVLCCLCLWFGFSVGLVSVGFAQSTGTFLPEKVKWKTQKKDGWFPDVDVSFNFSFSQSDGVIGVPDGTTLNFGVQLKAGITYSSGPHEWRNSLLILHTQTKLPTIEPFLKSADKIEAESAYTYRFTKSRWIGVFGSLRMESALLPGFLVKDTNANLLITEVDAQTKTDTLVAQTPYKLTEGFAPFLFKQSLGLSMTPVERTYFRLNIKVGGGAIETWTQGGLRIDDKADTADILELARLQDYFQFGAEAKLAINGVFASKVINYSLLSTVMIPFYTSIATTRSIPELINFDLTFKLGIKVFQWLSINYALAVVLVPLVQPKVQVTNNLVLSLTWSIL